MADDGTNLPARQLALDRSALERVLARAAELQAADADPSEATVTEGQLIDIGKEVGLSPEHLRQALAEERARVSVPNERGGLARLFGPAYVWASRTVRGTPDGVLQALDAWMEREESLHLKRRFADRMLWEPRPGFATEIKRALNIGGRGYHLSRAHEVAATAVAVDAERVLVRLEANLANVRLQRIASGGVMTGSGALASGILIVLGFLPALAALPAAAALGGGYVLARSHTPLVARAQLALEQVLDRLERGEMPPPPLLSALSSTTRLVR
jgi:hypothetical protein